MANTYNPIISKEDLPRWRLFQRRPVPEPGIAIVLSGDGQPLVTIETGERGLTNGELLWGKYNRLCKVDIGEHSLSFQCSLPCETDAFDFYAEVNLICSVKKPALIVQRNITDARQFLEPLIIDIMRRTSRKYKVEESGEAERTITRKVEEEVEDSGFKLNRFTLKLSLETETRERIRERKHIQETIVTEKAKIEGTIEIEKIKQELEIQRSQFEIERTKIRMDFYGPIIQAGNWQLLASQLASSPQDVALIMDMIKQQQLMDRNDKIQLLKILIETDSLEGTQLGDSGKRLLQELTGLSEQSLPALKPEFTNNANVEIVDKTENDINAEIVDKTENEIVDSTPDEFKRE